MDYTIIEINKLQFQVKPGDQITLLGIVGNEGDVVKANVLLTKSGEKTEIGTPTLPQTVSLKIVSLTKTDKVDIFKYRAKSRYRRHTGHRQEATVLEVLSDAKSDKPTAKAKTTVTKAPKK